MPLPVLVLLRLLCHKLNYRFWVQTPRPHSAARIVSRITLLLKNNNNNNPRIRGVIISCQCAVKRIDKAKWEAVYSKFKHKSALVFFLHSVSWGTDAYHSNLRGPWIIAGQSGQRQTNNNPLSHSQRAEVEGLASSESQISMFKPHCRSTKHWTSRTKILCIQYWLVVVQEGHGFESQPPSCSQ